MRGPIPCLDTRASTSYKWKQLVASIVICIVTDVLKFRRRSREQWNRCARPMLLSRLFIGRMSPRNLQRFSSFDTPNVREASLGSSEVGGTAQANLQRNTVRTQARHGCCIAAKKEETSPSSSGSSGLQRSSATRSISQSSNGTHAARGWETVASGDDVFCSYLGSVLSVCPFLCCFLDRFWICDGCSVEHGKKSAVQRPRVSNESHWVEAALLVSTTADALLRARLKCSTSSLVRRALASRADSHDATRDERDNPQLMLRLQRARQLTGTGTRPCLEM